MKPEKDIMITEIFIPTAILLILALIGLLIFIINTGKLRKDLSEIRKEHKRLDSLNRSMLEITQAIVGTDNPEDLYSIILEKAIAALPSSSVGSVMIMEEDGYFRCIAHKGFDDEKIKNFAIPLEETILWKYTKGNISTSVIIDDVITIEGVNIKPLTVNPEEWSIRSTIAVPLFAEEKLKGIVHIDSRNSGAFTDDDLRTMEQIRGNIEIALQKYLLYQKMVNMSRFDSLTGAFNRNYFMDQFSSTLNKAERYKQKFSLLIFDINDLKAINDSHGHLAGDKVLQIFSEMTMKLIRKSDTFSRWGGDEFMAIFYEMGEEEIAEKVARIRQALADDEQAAGKPYLPPRFSYGHAFYPDEGNDFDKLLRIADNRMYINKKKTKSRPAD